MTGLLTVVVDKHDLDDATDWKKDCRANRDAAARHAMEELDKALANPTTPAAVVSTLAAKYVALALLILALT